MSLQLGSLILAGLPGEQVLARVAGFDQVAHVASLARYGFNPIELGGDLSIFLPHTFSPSVIEQLTKLKSKQEISFTVHLPLWSVEPSTPLDPVRRGSVQAVVQLLKATLPLEPEVYVLHATGALAAEFYRMNLPEVAKQIILRQFQEAARQSLKTILAETGIPSRKLAIETIEFPFDLTLKLAEELDLSICLDTGHVLSGFSGPVDLFEVLEHCLPRLAEVHLHDSPWQESQQEIEYGRDHQALGTGDLDVGRFFDQLSADGFEGPIIFELGVEQALASLEMVRQVRPELFTS
jgi:sugar phosphate isomerase/epimerase